MSQRLLLPPPSTIDDDVKDFCSGISADAPVYVPVEPEPDANPSYCFDNVAHQIEEYGGSVAYGWAIWQWPGAYLEAEHHGIWRNDRGQLIDITPGIDHRRRILFQPDQSATYDPSTFRNNILAAKKGNPLAFELVATMTDAARLLNSYRAPGVVEPQFSFADAIRFRFLQAQFEKLSGELRQRHPI